VSPRILRRVVAAPLFALSIGACSTQAPPDLDRATPTTAPPSECAVVAAEPGLAVHQLNESLPIEGADVSFTQREVLLEAGGGPCGDDPAEAVLDECRLVSGRYELVSGVRLWREQHDFAEHELAAGAQRILAEDVTGYTENDETFHWRAVAVEYPGPTDVHDSPAWDVISACDELQADRVGSEVVSLSQGGEPFLAAQIDGATLYVVETWISTDPDGADTLSDTDTGLLPADAVSKILSWFIEEHSRL
jgi:hypothetical protein